VNTITPAPEEAAVSSSTQQTSRRLARNSAEQTTSQDQGANTPATAGGPPGPIAQENKRWFRARSSCPDRLGRIPEIDGPRLATCGFMERCTVIAESEGRKLETWINASPVSLPLDPRYRPPADPASIQVAACGLE